MDIESMHKQYEKLLKEGNCYPVAYRPVLARLGGSVNAGVMLSQALYWTFRTGPDGWFYKKADDWELETGLSRHEQTGARRLLRENGLIEEKVKRAPPIVHFRVNLPKVLQGIKLATESRIASSRTKPFISQQILEKAEIQVDAPEQFNLPKKRKSYKGTEITTNENTAEITNSTPEVAALKTWLTLKEQTLKSHIDQKEWKLWARPAYLVKLLGGSTLLIALPPNGRIIEAATARLPLLRELARDNGYGLNLTRYPDEYERERLGKEHPGFYAAMFGNKSSA
jgi:hypothetical protein